MPYVTIPRRYRERQMSFDDMAFGIDPEVLKPRKDTHDTTTYWCEYTTNKTNAKFDLFEMYAKLAGFVNKYGALIATENKATLYRSFKIPKRSGGLRQIDAPNDELMDALRELKTILEDDFCFTYHSSAFAYVQNRCAVDAVRRHQTNGSRWVLKTDLSKFFPHTTPEWMFKMLYQTFPLSLFVQNDERRKMFEKALSLCFLNGGLPQGTPTSPMLTNQMMIPVDYKISKYCREHTPYLVYTRYADDMDFSSKWSFRFTDVVDAVAKIMADEGAPFSFNREKTHYGSTAGRNWMLGVMLNKDGKITVGHENKKNFKVMLFSFGNSVKDGTPWSVDDTQHLMGLWSYYKSVEGETIDELVQKYNDKFGFSLLDAMKAVIKGEQAI